MAWVKDEVSRAPKTVYAAPESAFPIAAAIFDPTAVHKWSIEYVYLTGPEETQATIEAVMGL